MKAALCVHGRVVVGDSHLACFQELTKEEQNADMVSGFFDCETKHFISEEDRRGFYDKELYLIRHGKCDDPDQPDPDISAEGEFQVRKLAALFSGENIQTFEGISSPLLRCLRTAQILQKVLNLHFTVRPDVMETPTFLKDNQVFRLRNRSQMFPQFDWPTSQEWHVIPESGEDFFARVKETLQHLPPRSIVVTHYGYICLTAKMALCKKAVNDGFPTASVTYLFKSDVRSLRWQDAEILEDRPPAADRKAG